MASSTRRPAPIASDFSRDRRTFERTEHAARGSTFDVRYLRIGVLIAMIILCWAIDTFVFEHAAWNAVCETVTPILRRWQWAWTMYWRRGA